MPARCNAKINHTPGRIARAAACGPDALAAFLKRDRCKNYPLRGKTRCKFHGGRAGRKPKHRVHDPLPAAPSDTSSM
jgi:hypothetical protein